ncbi:hypothetical protein E2C01_036988 [Portunus trituberculatus]|uniref:Uncharacterized protein n=1 Tax=Portunus trituberculatus TaxID=210409 RepID=A0A5B7FDY8_PORTR|nr:hypothetical protein [Portunus trituberculatus]
MTKQMICPELRQSERNEGERGGEEKVTLTFTLTCPIYRSSVYSITSDAASIVFRRQAGDHSLPHPVAPQRGVFN